MPLSRSGSRHITSAEAEADASLMADYEVQKLDTACSPNDGFLVQMPTLDEFDKDEHAIVMDYKTHDLAQWKTYRFVTGTVMQNIVLRWLVARLFAMSFAIGVVFLYTGFKPAWLFHMQLDKLNKTLNFFVGIMLGFFLTNAVNRWVDAVGGCLMLFDSIRNLTMQFLALGVDKLRMHQITRYGLLSCEFLAFELHLRSVLPEHRERDLKQLIEGHTLDTLDAWEKDIIVSTFKEQGRVSSQVWIWVASLIGRMAQDGDVPPMASPTYGRIMNLAQDAQEGIRQVRVSMTVQLPFIYVHTLAFLVHMNNICAAINFGAVLARNVAGMLFHFGLETGYSKLLAEPVADKDARFCFETIITGLILEIIPALMFQAVLQIGLIMAQPFDETFGKGISVIPTRHLINQLKSDIQKAERMAKCVPDSAWSQPHFKKPAEAK